MEETGSFGVEGGKAPLWGGQVCRLGIRYPVRHLPWEGPSGTTEGQSRSEKEPPGAAQVDILVALM